MNISIIQSSTIKMLVLSILSIIGILSCNAQEYTVTYQQGHELTYKPSLTQRIQGTRDVVLIVPRQQNDAERYMYTCIGNYFRRLGIPVKEYPAKFQRKSNQIGNVMGAWGELAEDVSDSWGDANTLLVLAHCVSTYGYYLGEQNNVKISVIDPINDFTWNIDFDMPNKEEKFDKKLKSYIASSYTYSKSAAHIPSSYKSNWNGEWKFKEYFNKGSYSPLEGVYEGDNYKLAMKKGSDGKYYLVYLSGKNNPRDWSVGDIKAILEPTATPTVFKGSWYGRWKQKMDYTFIFKDGLFTAYDEDKNPEQFIKLYPALLSQQEGEASEWSGTGFALKNGYIVTNFHVIEGASSITIKGIKGNFQKSYEATVVGSDKNNDLALLKISDSSFGGFGAVPYSVSSSSAEVGEDIFVLGYPLTSTMGDEIKLTTGIISSKTGFQGDVSLYQISAPIQPGNSGGPLFDKKGNIVGVVSAKHSGAENVGYAIKSSYLRNLIESCASSSIIPTTNTVATLPLTGKVKAEKNFVFFIECSSTEHSNPQKPLVGAGGNNPRVINNPTFTRKANNKLKILQVVCTDNETVLELSDNNSYPGGYYQWFSISPEAKIVVNGVSYGLKRADGIALSPNVTYFSSPNETKTFSLIFPAIPKDTKSFDFIESSDSEWRIYGISLK